ncbi:MAG: DNRLRE domain-containing protein [Candidatus Sumerlaeota bacterium]|nr:DNRLRE domain-containing protein [Candidatus Sumerlaeota bacterium]
MAALILAQAALGVAATVSFYPCDDACVRGGTYANTRLGALPPDSASLNVKFAGSNNDYTRVAYLKFDLSGTSGVVQSANLLLTVSARDTAGTGQDFLKKVNNDAWAEANITSATQPTDWATSLLATWIAPAAGSTVSIDLTDTINRRTSDYLSLAIYSNDGRSVVYYSKDQNPQNVWPRLVVTGAEVSAPGPTGRVRMEYWEGLTPPTINGLKAAPGYPNKPTGRDYPASLETVRGFRDNYGVRLRGYFHAPLTGNYVFYLSAAAAAQLLLSTDDATGSLRPSPVAEVTSATNWRDWSAAPSQQSSPIALVKGQKYYFEALMAAGVGDDHLSIGWQLPDGSFERPVPGDRVSPYLANESVPPAGHTLDYLTAAHPRIMASEHTFARVRQKVVSDPDMQDRWASLKSSADALLSQPPSTYIISTGRLLGVSRQVLGRVQTLAMAYRISGDAVYLRRAVAEMYAVSQFPDWHPSHFLDTAEMTAAVAIGYDWLYNDLVTSERLVLRTAIRDFGLKPGLAVYKGGSGWGVNNWNQVCNGGMGMGALAIADDDPATASAVLDKALAYYNLLYMVPDGGWAEGPGYWGYATQYMSYLFSSAETAVGCAYGLAERLGMKQTGFFPICMNRPSHKVFGFSDAGSGEVTNSPQHYWFAWRYGEPAFSRYQREYDRSSGQEMLWFDNRGQLPGDIPLALDRTFQSCGVAEMRGSWDWGYPTFAGLKAGVNNGGHWHLDLGSFVMDALGQEFAMDLGGNDYGTVGVSDYFDNAQRWKYYKVRAEGHNTLMLNPDNQADQAFGSAPITSFRTDAEGAYTIADLTQAYKSDATKVRRGLMMRNYRREVIVQDEVTGLGGAKDLYWFLHTRAAIQILDGGRSAMLTQSGQRVWAHILDAPTSAVFGVMNAVPLPTSPVPKNGQDATTGIQKLFIHNKGAATVRLVVWLVPLPIGQNPPTTMPAVLSLDSWGSVVFNDPGTGFGAAPRPNLITLTPPASWKPDIGAIAFRVYSGLLNHQKIPIAALADNPSTPGLDYYFYELTADWIGWKQFTIPIADFAPVGSPLGWDKITQVQFRADGWDATRLGDSVLNVEGLDSAPIGDLFGDVPAPQYNLIFKPPDPVGAKTGAVSFSLYSYAPTRQDLLLLCMSENAVNGSSPDYYSYGIDVNWTGWKQFSVPLKSFSTARLPLGWDQLNEIRFYTNGWSHTLTTGTVLCLRDFQIALPTTYTLAVTSDHGRVDVAPKLAFYDPGATVTLMVAAVDAGWVFDSWTGDVPAGAEHDNPLTMIMDRNRAVTAHYASATPTGTVIVDARPSSASWSLTDSLTQTWNGTGPATITSVTAGAVQITWLPLDGFDAPLINPMFQTLATGATITFQGRYSLPLDLLLSYLAGKTASLSAAQLEAADINNDAAVDIADVIALIKLGH